MNKDHIQTIGSFFRNGKYPLEADYIFTSVEALKEWEEQNRKYLHPGLFKVVELEDKQILYWYDHDTFEPALESDSLENLAMVLKDFELHGQLRDLLRDIKNSYESKFKAVQQELDNTQSGVGLNGDGTFDMLNMKNTTYLDGARSVVEALKALDREMSTLVVDAFIEDAYYDSDDESIVIVFNTKQEQEKTLRINVSNLIREWEPDNSQPSKVVEITRQDTHGPGTDKVSADVRLSTKKDNILEKDGNTLIVRGTTDNITHEGQRLDKIINEVKKLDPYVFETYQEAVDANLPIGETFLLKNTEVIPVDIFPNIDHDGHVLWVQDETWWSQLMLYRQDSNGTWVTPWPGDSFTGSFKVNDTLYKYWDLGENNEGKVFSSVFNNNAGSQFDGPSITVDKDYYLKLSSSGYEIIEGFNTVTYYKGLYAVTPEGFKALSLDEELKENLEGLIERVDQNDQQINDINETLEGLPYGGVINYQDLFTNKLYETQPGYFYSVVYSNSSNNIGILRVNKSSSNITTYIVEGDFQLSNGELTTSTGNYNTYVKVEHGDWEDSLQSIFTTLGYGGNIFIQELNDKTFKQKVVSGYTYHILSRSQVAKVGTLETLKNIPMGNTVYIVKGAIQYDTTFRESPDYNIYVYSYGKWTNYLEAIKNNTSGLSLRWKDNNIELVNTIDNSVVSSISGSEFIKDGMLNEVELIGDELLFTFNTDSGKQAIRVNMSKFIDTYTAGDGIEIVHDSDTDTSTISTKLANSYWLDFAEGKLKFQAPGDISFPVYLGRITMSNWSLQGTTEDAFDELIHGSLGEYVMNPGVYLNPTSTNFESNLEMLYSLKGTFKDQAVYFDLCEGFADTPVIRVIGTIDQDISFRGIGTLHPLLELEALEEYDCIKQAKQWKFEVRTVQDGNLSGQIEMKISSTPVLSVLTQEEYNSYKDGNGFYPNTIYIVKD